jgi:hypothetical protein
LGWTAAGQVTIPAIGVPSFDAPRIHCTLQKANGKDAANLKRRAP